MARCMYFDAGRVTISLVKLAFRWVLLKVFLCVGRGLYIYLENTCLLGVDNYNSRQVVGCSFCCLNSV